VQRELEKVKERRLNMEKERTQREEEMWLEQRSKEAEQFKEWQKQEEMFHLEQAKLRSKIRIMDGRAKPIDLLAKYISAQNDVDAVDLHEPYTYLAGLRVEDLEDLIEDIKVSKTSHCQSDSDRSIIVFKVYQELERGENEIFWEDMKIVVHDELAKLRLANAAADADQRGSITVERVERPGVHSSVTEDVASIFKGKTPEQLEALKLSITTKVDLKKSGQSTAKVDLPYWESLLQQLHGKSILD
jgi:hypothetical protein